MRDRFNKVLAYLLSHIIKVLGKLRMPYSKKRITGKQFKEILEIVKTGDVLLTTNFGELSNLFNPSIINHGALCIKTHETPTIYEAIGKGVSKTDLISFVMKKDIVLIARPLFIKGEDNKKILNSTKNKLGIPYDYEFILDNNNLYCFELIKEIFNEVYPDIKLKKFEFIKDFMFYSSDTFIGDKDNFKVIYDSRNSC